MSNFNEAIEPLLGRESGFVDSPHDKGGATNYGISLRFLKSINPQATVDTIKNLTVNEAKEIYRKYFWDANNLDMINDKDIAEKIFDMLVNMGAKAAALIVQKAINFLWRKRVIEDGVMGKQTISAINQENSDLLLISIRLNCVRHYVDIVEADKTQQRFFFGWIRNRALL